MNAGSSSVGYRGGGDGGRAGTLPAFVPARFAPAIARAAQRWSVSGALLAAQLYEESHFNPFARSAAGALGIAQFMPATAAGYGLADPFDAERAIDAQAHLMRDLLRSFASVPLALAAYNAGAARVQACGCVPPIPETESYVADLRERPSSATTQSPAAQMSSTWTRETRPSHGSSMSFSAARPMVTRGTAAPRGTIRWLSAPSR